MDGEGFFSAAELASKRPIPLLAQCGKCQLYQHCDSPKMKVFGDGKLGIMFVSEYPGQKEDESGQPFMGNAGNMLKEILYKKCGIDVMRDCWLTNAIICYPKDTKLTKETIVEYCRPNLTRSIRELNPRVIVLMGKSAIKSFVGHAWKSAGESFAPTRWAGWRIPCRKPNAWVCPTFNPAYAQREENRVKETKEETLIRAVFTEHIKRAVQLKGRPWDEIPDESREVCVILNDDEAAAAVETYTKISPLVAFDYETTTLKPDGPHAEIVCCSVSDGQTTIAYPWTRKTAEATRELLRSDVAKVASNAKFEERWTRKFLHCRVRNWDHDTMLAAHVLDGRGGITSIKFQAFVRLGVPDYDSHIESYLKSKDGSGNSPNRIRELDLFSVLKYCGQDSLYEFQVMKKQKKEANRGRNQQGN